MRFDYSEFIETDSTRWPDQRWRLHGLEIWGTDGLIYDSTCGNEKPDDAVGFHTVEVPFPEDARWVGIFGEHQADRISHAT